MKIISTTAIVACVLLVGCDEIPQTGIIKNVSNGITTTYKNIKPEEVFQMMNGERFDHNQIPLGESFQVINDKIDLLTVKDGKVSIGCQLVIADKKGTVLLDEKDLFSDNSVFEKDSITFLRCTVNTGQPMEYDQFYDVTIRYWDKFGNGTLENKLTIEIIDIP